MSGSGDGVATDEQRVLLERLEFEDKGRNVCSVVSGVWLHIHGSPSEYMSEKHKIISHVFSKQKPGSSYADFQ